MRKAPLYAALAALALFIPLALAGSTAQRTSLASWYGPGLYGNRMGCGGRLTPSSMNVAHKTLRCGTKLVVCYGGRCRRTWVGDRGPYVSGRELDLAAGLARALRFSGVHYVRWSVVR